MLREIMDDLEINYSELSDFFNASDRLRKQDIDRLAFEWSRNNSTLRSLYRLVNSIYFSKKLNIDEFGAAMDRYTDYVELGATFCGLTDEEDVDYFIESVDDDLRFAKN